MARKSKKAEEAATPTTSTFTPSTANIESTLNNPDNAIPFVEPESISDTPTTIILPGTAFFDQELGDVIFNKLMKAPVKDYQVLLRLSKLWKTINDISHKLANLRDAISKDCELDTLADPKNEAQLTPELLNSPEYQAKSMAFWSLIQKYVFARFIDLAPLWTLTLDLTNPDGHARAFLEGSSLSADDIDMLNSFRIIKVVYPAEEAVPAETAEPAETAQEEKGSTSNEVDDVLVPNED